MITKDFKYCVQKPRVYSKERERIIGSLILMMFSLFCKNMYNNNISSYLFIFAVIELIISYKQQKFNDNYIKVLKAMGEDSYLDVDTLADITKIDDIEQFLNKTINKKYFKRATIDNGIFYVDEEEVVYFKESDMDISKIDQLELLSNQILDIEFKNEVKQLVENIRKNNQKSYVDDAIKIIKAYIEIENSDIKDKQILDDIKNTISKMNNKYDDINNKEMEEKIQDLKTDLYVLNTIIEEE